MTPLAADQKVTTVAMAVASEEMVAEKPLLVSRFTYILLINSMYVVF